MREGLEMYLKQKIFDSTKYEKGLESRLLEYMRRLHLTCKNGEIILPV